MKGNRTNNKRRWLVPAILTALIAAVFILTAIRPQPPKLNDKAVSGVGASSVGNDVAEYTLKLRSTRETVEVTGNVKAWQSADFGFARTGRIKNILVSTGDNVSKGQLLAELDNASQQYEIASTKSAIEKVRISGSTRELADLELKKQAVLEMLREFQIISTLSGHISDVQFSAGEIYEIGKSSGSYVVRVIDDSRIISDVKIDEVDAPKVRIGQRVIFSFDALPDAKIEGRVISLPIEGIVDSSGIAKLKTRLEVPSPPKSLLSGYSYTAEIVIAENQPILVLDEKAVSERNGSFSVLKRSSDGSSTEKRTIDAVKLGDGTVKVLSGLSEGDRVLDPEAIARATGGKAKNPLELLGLKPPENGPGGGPTGGGPASRGPGGGK